MKIGSKEIFFLLGAGASADAGIPTSKKMIEHIETLVGGDNKWMRYADLYNHVKSSIHHAAGIRGRFGRRVHYNIETLVNTLNELDRNEGHPLFPFIASWNQRFTGLAGPNFDCIRQFKRLILERLKKWMCPDDTSRGQYYEGFVRLQESLNFTLYIFSLNYDLCIEQLSNDNFRIETGFAGFGPQHYWDWQRFGEDYYNDPPQIQLHKLHGSINWKRDPSTKHLYSVNQVQSIDSSEMEVIFGQDFKLEAGDPYLFYAYEFRRFTLISPLIVVIGYGFGDPHINKMLSQSLHANNNSKLLVICECEENGQTERESEIKSALDVEGVETRRVEVFPGTAKGFLEASDIHDILSDRMPRSTDDPF